jgi:hypothetical protein
MGGGKGGSGIPIRIQSRPTVAENASVQESSEQDTLKTLERRGWIAEDHAGADLTFSDVNGLKYAQEEFLKSDPEDQPGAAEEALCRVKNAMITAVDKGLCMNHRFEHLLLAVLALLDLLRAERSGQ